MVWLPRPALTEEHARRERMAHRWVSFDKFCPQGSVCISILSVVAALGNLLGKLVTGEEGAPNRRWKTTKFDSNLDRRCPGLAILGWVV